MEEIIKKAIEGGYAIQKSYYARPVVFTKLKTTNEYYTVFELDDTTVVEDKNGEEVTVPLTSSHQTSMIILDPLFWQAISNACGWENSERYWSVEQEVKITLLDSWENTAMTFHHKNLTEGWNQAVAYLQEVTK
jgi:hypothetical protein